MVHLNDAIRFSDAPEDLSYAGFYRRSSQVLLGALSLIILIPAGILLWMSWEFRTPSVDTVRLVGQPLKKVERKYGPSDEYTVDDWDRRVLLDGGYMDRYFLVLDLDAASGVVKAEVIVEVF